MVNPTCHDETVDKNQDPVKIHLDLPIYQDVMSSLLLDNSMFSFLALLRQRLRNFSLELNI